MSRREQSRQDKEVLSLGERMGTTFPAQKLERLAKVQLLRNVRGMRETNRVSASFVICDRGDSSAVTIHRGMRPRAHGVEEMRFLIPVLRLVCEERFELIRI